MYVNMYTFKEEGKLGSRIPTANYLLFNYCKLIAREI